MLLGSCHPLPLAGMDVVCLLFSLVLLFGSHCMGWKTAWSLSLVCDVP